MPRRVRSASRYGPVRPVVEFLRIHHMDAVTKGAEIRVLRHHWPSCVATWEAPDSARPSSRSLPVQARASDCQAAFPICREATSPIEKTIEPEPPSGVRTCRVNASRGS